MHKYKYYFLFASSIKTYPPRLENESLVSSAEDAYTHAKDFLEGIQLNQDKSSSTSKYRDHREKNLKHVVSWRITFLFFLLLLWFLLLFLILLLLLQ